MTNSKVMIQTNKGYLTRKSFTSEFSFTNNENFAYIFDNEEVAERIIDDLGLEKAKIRKFGEEY